VPILIAHQPIFNRTNFLETFELKNYAESLNFDADGDDKQGI